MKVSGGLELMSETLPVTWSHDMVQLLCESNRATVQTSSFFKFILFGVC